MKMVTQRMYHFGTDLKKVRERVVFVDIKRKSAPGRENSKCKRP